MKFAQFLLVSVAACLLVPANAQPWLAEEMLARIKGPTVFIRDKEGRVKESVDRAAIERSVNVLQRLASAYEMPAPTLYVLPANSPNAFATTTKAGTPLVAINTAMLRVAGSDEDYLAVVMGHELGHLKGRHTTDGADRAKAIGVIGLLLGAAIDIGQAQQGRNTSGLGMQLGAAGSRLVNAKFSRDQEREADQLGAIAMAKAGFDPSMAARFWAMMPGGGGSGTWFDSHPSHEERQGELRAMADRLRPVYEAARGATEVRVTTITPRPSAIGSIERSMPSTGEMHSTPLALAALTSCVEGTAGPREVFEQPGRGRMEIVRVLGPDIRCQNPSRPLLAEIKQFGPPEPVGSPISAPAADVAANALTSCVSSSAGAREVFEEPSRGRMEIVRVLGPSALCKDAARPLLAEVKPFGPPEALSLAPQQASTAQRLRDLKRLREENLITQPVYESRQLEILNSR